MEGRVVRGWVLRQPIFFQRLIWGLGDTWAQPRQHGLHLGLLHVLLQMRPGDPVFVKQEERMVVQGLVEVIVQTTHMLAARGDQRQQFLPDLAFFVWLRFDLRGDGE